ncbi:hypothetical protein DPMN_104920 [Dreissena polymorpha]|uniref:Uncharacterized protein n=1 Tax=Dreissena polymorpha TaxID=45954 RepID=A0A9D4K0G6_DREPO|nr:hypothetical protein DPMN_104920 [Dreissena polymorpha]
MQLGHVQKTYEGVIVCLVRDQLLGISQKELYLFLKSKSFTDSSETERLLLETEAPYFTGPTIGPISSPTVVGLTARNVGMVRGESRRK